MDQSVQPEDGPRGRLLEAAIDHLGHHGLRDSSLRQLAAAIGTSHRMLIYHFGSPEGLLAAIVERVMRQELEGFRAVVEHGGLDRAGLLRAMWRHLSAATQAPSQRLFFELYGQALGGRPGTEVLLGAVVDDWLDVATAGLRRAGVPAKEARTAARLDLAVLRGLLLDLVTTGDRAATKRSLDAYVTGHALLTQSRP